MISDIERLKRIFERMNSDGYDVKNYLKWGFYFFDQKEGKLSKLSTELINLGYTFENLSIIEDGDWRLYVSVVDVLTPEELHNRNIYLNKLASNHNVALYDGWDVEKIN